MQHYYTVLDSRTKDPIENALISSSIPSVYQTNSFGVMTNNKGKVDIKYSKLPIYKQILYTPSTTINVTKNGYENLNTEVSLAFFKTNKSEIYLSSLRRDTVVIVKPNPEIIQIPCENGELHDESGDKELRVDLGKKNSTFLFEYFNENQIDTIKVYSDDRSLLFKCNWSTRTTDFQDSIELTYPSRYVIVTV